MSENEFQTARHSVDEFHVLLVIIRNYFLFLKETFWYKIMIDLESDAARIWVGSFVTFMIHELGNKIKMVKHNGLFRLSKILLK